MEGKMEGTAEERKVKRKQGRREIQSFLSSHTPLSPLYAIHVTENEQETDIRVGV